MATVENASIDASGLESLRLRSLIDLLQHRAAEQPQKKAYTFLVDGETEEVSLSYGELDQRARAIGEYLSKKRLYGERALLLYPAGLDFITGLFGCLYARLVAVPAYPPDPARPKRTLSRLEAIAVDAQAKVALTTPSLLSGLERILRSAPALRSMEWLSPDMTGRVTVDSSIESRSSDDDIVFLQYTSGSTGNPRGVALTNSNLIHNAAMVRAFCQHSYEDLYVSWLPPFHDMGFMAGVLQPLFSGIPAVLMSPAAFLERPFRWLRAISHYRATTSGGPNFAYDLCVRKINPEERANLDLSSWTVAFNGSEPVRKETLERFSHTFDACGFHRDAMYPCYGLAEATLIVTGGRRGNLPIVKSFESSALGEGKAVGEMSLKHGQHALVSCGRASHDQRIEIVHPEMTTKRAAGDIGEIWVSGPSVGKGYWNNPAETKKTFHAYIADSGEGPFLRTGDLGFIKDRELFVTGRLKDLIIIRGINHYPQDIEATAEHSHAALRQGCGAAFGVDIGGEERLVVVQEVDDRKQADPNEITRSIRQAVTEDHELQIYALVLVKPGTIPKTSSGKVQRGACKKEFLEGALEEIHRNVANDRSDQLGEDSLIRKALLAIERPKRLSLVESYILERVAHLLRLPQVENLPERSLLAMGIDSLTAIELKNQIEAEIGTTVPASKLLEGCNARELALLVSYELEAQARSVSKLSRSDERSASEYPLSFTQRALWFFHELAPQSPAYNVPLAIRISSSIDGAALKRAFRSLVERHACLRTTFALRDGQVFQQVSQNVLCDIEYESTSPSQQDELRRVLAEEAYRPFDLERGPLYRSLLFTQSPQDHVLLLTIHHIVIDGWSFWMLLDDLFELYEAETAGLPRFPPAPRAEYSDYVRWQAEMLQSEDGERLFEFWRRELSGDLPVLKLPTSRLRPPVQTFLGKSFGFALNADVVSRVRELALSKGATLYMVLLAVFELLLHRHTGQDDILVGSPISARSRAEFERIAGCFFNAIVIRGDFSNDVTFTALLDQVRRKVLGAMDHQEYPAHLLAERLQPVRDPSRSPLFQATFTLQKQQKRGHTRIPIGTVQMRAAKIGLRLSVIPVDREHVGTEIEMEMIETDGAIHAWLHYNRELFDESTIGRMAGHFKVLLEGAVSNPDHLLSCLPMLTEDESKCLLAQEMVDPDSYNYSGIEELFLEQAKKAPAKVAAVYNDCSITFDELNKSSEQLARLMSRLA